MAADDVDEDSELDTFAPEQPPSPLQKEAKSFDYPIASEKDQSEATARILKTLNKVDDSVHFNLQGRRRTDTLHVGNLEYHASKQDPREALDNISKRVWVEKITIPRVKCRST